MAVVVVPGGFGEHFRTVIAAGARLVEGAKRGEAGVDFLIVEDETIIEWLRCDGCPVIGVMALLADGAADMDSLGALVEHSDRWSLALRLWRRWRARQTEDENEELIFRATALREDGLPSGAPSVNAIAKTTGGGVWRRWKWKVDMNNFDIEVCSIWLSDCVVVAVPLTPQWRACAKSGFFPPEPQQYVSSCMGMLQLRRSICYGLLLKANLRPGDLVVDPMAGVGSIPAEALVRFGCRYVVAGDFSRNAARQCMDTARKCQERSGASCDALRWDVRKLPLRSGSVDKIVTDYPWGNRTKSDALLLQALLHEVARVLATNGLAVILLLRTMAQQIERIDCGLMVTETMNVVVGGWPVAVVTLRHGNPSADGSACEAVPKAIPVNSSCCCAVHVCDRLAQLSVSELLVNVWPQIIPNQSTARRAVKHGRVCLASAPSTALWWRDKVAVGERVVLRPHCARFQSCGLDLEVLWETDDWMAVVKPPGLSVLQGRKSLANAVYGMQEERAPKGTAWTVAYDGDAKVGGAWLVAKSPLAALGVLDSELRVVLDWQVVLKGTPAELPGFSCSALRSARSVRYKSITEARFSLPSPDTTEWRVAAASAGHPVVGDRPHCDGPSACMWVTAVRVENVSEHGPARDPLADCQATMACVPAKFQRLFDREAEVCKYADSGMLLSSYALRMAQLNEQEEEDLRRDEEQDCVHDEYDKEDGVELEEAAARTGHDAD